MLKVGDIYQELNKEETILLLNHIEEEYDSVWTVLVLDGSRAGGTEEYDQYDIVNWYEKVV
jgi:hypothetical protein